MATADTHRESWWCHYHGDIHVGHADDWSASHREEMEPLYTMEDVERISAGR